jgi:hypothetical protein
MDISLLFAQTHQAIALQCREEGPLAPVNQLQILGRRVPAIEQERARLDLLLIDRVDKHLMEMIVLRLAVYLWSVHPIVNRIELLVFACAMGQTDDANPPHHTMLIATVLRPYQFDEAGIAFVRHAIVHH